MTLFQQLRLRSFERNGHKWMMTWKLFAWKWSWPNFKVLCRYSSGGTEENHEKLQRGNPFSGPSSEPGTTRTRSRRINIPTKTFGLYAIILRKALMAIHRTGRAVTYHTCRISVRVLRVPDSTYIWKCFKNELSDVREQHGSLWQNTQIWITYYIVDSLQRNLNGVN
jgi:hypothetical protein